jgi:hypothetical protein
MKHILDNVLYAMGLRVASPAATCRLAACGGPRIDLKQHICKTTILSQSVSIWTLLEGIQGVQSACTSHLLGIAGSRAPCAERDPTNQGLGKPQLLLDEYSTACSLEWRLCMTVKLL